MKQLIAASVLLALILGLALDSEAKARRPYKRAIFLDNKQFPLNYPSLKDMKKYFKKNHRTTFNQAPDSKWRIHFVAFFPPTKDTKIYVVLFDLSKKKEYVNSYPFDGAKGLSMFTGSVTLDDTFYKAGHRYLLALKTREDGVLTKAELKLLGPKQEKPKPEEKK